MADIQSVTLSQTQNLSISRSVSASYERSESAVSLSASASAPPPPPSVDGFGGIFDVIDISDDARQQLLQNRADAENFAAVVAGERTEVLSAPLVIRNGRVEIDALAAQISEQFNITESYDVSFSEVSTLEVETDEGSFSITQSRLVEANFSSTVSFEQSASVGVLQARFSV